MNLKELRGGVPHRHGGIVAFYYLNTIQLGNQTKEAFKHSGHLEVIAQGFRIVGVLVFLQSFSPKRDIPGHRIICTLCVLLDHKGCKLRQLSLGGRTRGPFQFADHRQHRLKRRRHFAVDTKFGIVVEAHQLSLLLS